MEREAKSTSSSSINLGRPPAGYRGPSPGYCRARRVSNVASALTSHRFAVRLLRRCGCGSGQAQGVRARDRAASRGVARLRLAGVLPRIPPDEPRPRRARESSSINVTGLHAAVLLQALGYRAGRSRTARAPAAPRTRSAAKRDRSAGCRDGHLALYRVSANGNTSNCPGYSPSHTPLMSTPSRWCADSNQTQIQTHSILTCATVPRVHELRRGRSRISLDRGPAPSPCVNSERCSSRPTPIG